MQPPIHIARAVLLIAMLWLGVISVASACPAATPEAAARAFVTAAAQNDFDAVVRCAAPADKGVLAMLLMMQSGAAAGVFTGSGNDLSDMDEAPSSPAGKAFWTLIEKLGVRLGGFGESDMLEKDASTEALRERFLEVAGPDPDHTISELNRYLRETSGTDFGSQLTGFVRGAVVSSISGEGPVRTAMMSGRQVRLVKEDDGWYVADAWPLNVSPN